MSMHFTDTEFNELTKRGPFKADTDTTDERARCTVVDSKSNEIAVCKYVLDAEVIAKALNFYLLGINED